MRRPLNWIVVSISLMVLFANRMWAPRPAEAVAIRAPETPFAYVREDGTQEYLPLPDISFETWVDEVDTDPRTAVYTWSSPVIAAEPQPLKF